MARPLIDQDPLDAKRKRDDRASTHSGLRLGASMGLAQPPHGDRPRDGCNTTISKQDTPASISGCRPLVGNRSAVAGA